VELILDAVELLARLLDADILAAGSDLLEVSDQRRQVVLQGTNA